MTLASIRYGADEGATVDELLVRLVRELKACGVRVCGAVQLNHNSGDRSCDGMELEDPATGRRVLICESIATETSACRIDETALAEAIAWSEAGLDDGAELLIVNKFGKREASGRGFAPILLRAIERGVPVVVGVNGRNADAWEAFVARKCTTLPPDHEVVLGWCLRNAAPQHAGRAPERLFTS